MKAKQRKAKPKKRARKNAIFAAAAADVEKSAYLRSSMSDAPLKYALTPGYFYFFPSVKAVYASVCFLLR